MIVPCGQSIPHSIMVNYRFKCDLQFLLITIVNSSRLWYSLSNIYKKQFLILQTKLHLYFMACGRTFITMPNYHFNFPRRNFCVTIIITVFHDDVYFLESAAMNLMHFHRGKEIARKPNGS